MKNIAIKKIVDVLLLLSLILSICSWDRNLTTHIIIGVTFTFLLAVHIFLNRKWLVSVTKTFKAGKLNNKVKLQYSINLPLIVVWGIVILSGLSAVSFAIGGKENLFIFSRIHGISIRLGCLLIIIHVFQHRKQINSYIKRKSV